MLSLMVSTAALLSPPRVAITGSTGKLGTEAVKQLVAAVRATNFDPAMSAQTICIDLGESSSVTVQLHDPEV